MSLSDTLNLVAQDIHDEDGPWSRALSTLGRLVRPDITVTDPPEARLLLGRGPPGPHARRDPVAGQRVPSRRR